MIMVWCQEMIAKCLYNHENKAIENTLGLQNII